MWKVPIRKSAGGFWETDGLLFPVFTAEAFPNSGKFPADPGRVYGISSTGGPSGREFRPFPQNPQGLRNLRPVFRSVCSPDSSVRLDGSENKICTYCRNVQELQSLSPAVSARTEEIK